MAEFTNSNIVTVAAGQNLPLTETAVKCGSCIAHREGAGIVTLRGLTNQCRARYKVSFGANIAIPAGGTVAPISIALAIAGEPLNSATANTAVAATGTRQEDTAAGVILTWITAITATLVEVSTM